MTEQARLMREVAELTDRKRLMREVAELTVEIGKQAKVSGTRLSAMDTHRNEMVLYLNQRPDAKMLTAQDYTWLSRKTVEYLELVDNYKNAVGRWLRLVDEAGDLMSRLEALEAQGIGDES